MMIKFIITELSFLLKLRSRSSLKDPMLGVVFTCFSGLPAPALIRCDLIVSLSQSLGDGGIYTMRSLCRSNIKKSTV